MTIWSQTRWNRTEAYLEARQTGVSEEHPSSPGVSRWAAGAAHQQATDASLCTGLVLDPGPCDVFMTNTV